MANFDEMSFAVNELSGGKNVVIMDDLGLPSIYVVIPKGNNGNVISGGSASVVHPAFIVDGVEKGCFYYSKYQNVVFNNRAYSLSRRDPAVSMNHDTAKKYCTNKGKGFHLSTMAEWAYLALWSRKNGTMPHGNSNYGCDEAYGFERGVVDPAFRAGQTLRLTGTQAEKFVRARMVLENDTNLARMKRQRAYMDSFQACAREAINTDSEFTMKLLEKLSDFLQSDMTAQQLSDLVTRLDKGTVSPIRYADGELLLGEKYYEFYPDEDSLWQVVKAACCE